MNDSKQVLDDGVVYVSQGSIVAVQKAAAPAPDGFDGLKVLETKGTIYPGLIDLHDHLSYNAIQLWDVPKRFTNRDQWAQGDTYRQQVTGPMKALAHTPKYVPAIVRYVECKCLVGGTTTTQGMTLSSFAGIQRFYKGIVRNVEQTGDPDLPQAGTHIADVDARDHAKFLKRLKSFDCLLLHLSEGTDESARKHFLALQAPSEEWAVTRLAGRDSLRRSPEAGLRGARRARSLDGLVTAQQPAALRGNRRRGRGARGGRARWPSGRTGRRAAARTCSESSRSRVSSAAWAATASPTSSCSRWRRATRRRSSAGTSSWARSRAASVPISSSSRETMETVMPTSSRAASTTSSWSS